MAFTINSSGQPVWAGNAVPAAHRTNLIASIAALGTRVQALEDYTPPDEEDLEIRKAEVTLGVASGIDDRIAGLTGTTAQKSVFSTMDHATPTYVRGAEFWARDVDLTCASPWNSGNANLWAGTAFTPYHIAMANHAYVATSSTIRFITMGNAVVTRTVVASVQVGSTDLRIGVLDSALPSTITPAKLLPDDYATWLTFNGLPIVCFDQEEKALIYEASLSGETIYLATPSDATRASFYELLISGDSGNPEFLIINGAPVLLSAQQPAIHTQKTGIQTAITALASSVPASSGAVWTEVVLYASVARQNVRGLNATPLPLPTFTVAGVPSAARYARAMIYVSNETGGATVAFSDGTNWRRVQDRAIVS